MTGQERDYEAILSRVLRTTTDQFEPVGDGLTKIRGRLSEPWLKRQWWLLRSEWIALRWLVVVRCESFFSTVKSGFSTIKSGKWGKSGSGVADPAAGPLAPLLACATPATEEHGRRRRSLRPVLGGITAWASGKQRRSVGPAMAWLRPALAVAGAVVLVVAGVFALGQIRQGLFLGLDNASGTNGSHTGQVPGNGNPYGGGATLKNSSSPSLGSSRPAKRGAAATHLKTLPSPGPCRSASPPPVSSPSPSPSPTSASPSPTPTTASPSPTPTSPSPSPTTSEAPITGGVAGHTQEAIGTTALVICGPTAFPSPTQASPGP